ncbi:MAG TPA: DMT family transporter [Pseudogracilibacillus sp.]|nr:DMT family transporter [Pseudogracilibacillus sp.]
MSRNVFFLGLLTVIFWASGFAAVRASLLGGFAPGQLILFRFIIASAMFLLYAIYPRSNFKLPKKEHLPVIIILSIIGITFYQFGVTFGQQSISAGTASMIVGSAPIFTTIIAVVILRERMNTIGWIGLFIGFIGVLLITYGSTGSLFTFSKGILFVLFGTISMSFFFVYQKRLFSSYHPIELTAYFTWIGSIPMLFFLPGLIENIQVASNEAIMSAIYVGIVPGALCYALWATALSLGNVSTLSSLLYLEPPIAIIIAFIWIKELPSIISMIGGLIAISSVAIVNFVERTIRRKAQQQT